MAKPITLTDVQPDYIGWFQPHAVGSKMTEQDNLVADPKTGEMILAVSMTKQSFKDECDINNIVKKFEATGQIDHLNQMSKEGVFQDLPDGLDYHSAMNTVIAGDRAFAALPAHVRARFDNNAGKFMDFMHDPKNQEEMITLGLATDLRPPKSDAPASPPAGGTGGGENSNQNTTKP